MVLTTGAHQTILKKSMNENEFNEKFNVNEIVGVLQNNGDILITKVIHKATTQGSGMCVAWLSGVTGACDAKKVHKLQSDGEFKAVNIHEFSRFVVLPIMKELIQCESAGSTKKAQEKIEVSSWKFNIPSYDLVGICIAEIRRLKTNLKNQKKAIIGLREKRESDAQAVMAFISSFGKGEEK